MWLTQYRNDNYLCLQLQGALEAFWNHNQSQILPGQAAVFKPPTKHKVPLQVKVWWPWIHQSSHSQAPHRGSQSCGWHTAACTTLLSPVNIYKQGRTFSLGCFSSMTATSRSSAYQLMTLLLPNFIPIVTMKRALRNLLITEYKWLYQLRLLSIVSSPKTCHFFNSAEYRQIYQTKLGEELFQFYFWQQSMSHEGLQSTSQWLQKTWQAGMKRNLLQWK